MPRARGVPCQEILLVTVSTTFSMALPARDAARLAVRVTVRVALASRRATGVVPVLLRELLAFRVEALRGVAFRLAALRVVALRVVAFRAAVLRVPVEVRAVVLRDAAALRVPALRAVLFRVEAFRVPVAVRRLVVALPPRFAAALRAPTLRFAVVLRAETLRLLAAFFAPLFRAPVLRLLEAPVPVRARPFVEPFVLLRRRVVELDFLLVAISAFLHLHFQLRELVPVM